MPICIECGYPVPQLYHVLHSGNAGSKKPPPINRSTKPSRSNPQKQFNPPAKTRPSPTETVAGSDVRLTQCPRCKRFADKYVEHDYVVLFIDLVLVKPQPSITRFGILLLLFDVYLTWSRIEALPSYLTTSSPIPHLPILFQYAFYVLLCVLTTAAQHASIRWLARLLSLGAKANTEPEHSPKAAHASTGARTVDPTPSTPNGISTALFVSSCMKLFPILMIVWRYEDAGGSVGQGVEWAVAVQNLEALRILLGYILTLNVSMLGRTTLNASASSSSVLGDIENSVKGDVNDFVAGVAKQLNIHDFYSAHVLDYCEGYFTPTAITNGTINPHKNVTRCSNHTALFHFDPSAIIQKELKPGISLTDLEWPSAIKDAVRAVEVASKAMFVLYCIGVAAAGLALAGAFLGVASEGKLTALVDAMLSLLAFIALGIASAISSAIMSKVVDEVNKHGNDIGIAASKGKTFLGMTWAATVLMFVAALAWIFEIFAHKRRSSSYVQEGKLGNY
ncbi:MAG: hypothetical protein Q9190_004796 [Brigantiaea leucoxantha]